MYVLENKIKMIQNQKMNPNKIMEYTKTVCEIVNTGSANMCNSILDLDQNVYFVGMIHDNGRLVDYAKRQNSMMKSLEKQDLDMICMQTRLHASMQSDHDENFGRFGYVITQREKTMLMTIPTQRGTLLVISSNKVDYGKLTQKIFQVIDDGYIAKARFRFILL